MSQKFAYYRSTALSASLTKATMPVLALGGQGVLDSNMCKNLEALASNVQGGQIDDCGYYVMDEQPENVAQKLLDFFHNQNFCPTSSSLNAHNFAAAVGSLAHGAGSPI
jgi:pimeloyl-ACP methyl ester carboxylesterase